MPNARRFGIGYGSLRAHVQRHAGRMPLRKAKRPQVAHDERVHLRGGKRLEVFRQRRQIVCMHKRVHGHEHARTRSVRERDRVGDIG